MIKYDYHLHSDFSGDSDVPAEVMIQRGIELGLAGICFTEHHDPDGPSGDDGTPFLLDFSSYWDKLPLLKKQYENQLSIGIGMEFTIQDHLADHLLALESQWPFDFIIASFHFINGQDPYYPVYFQGRDERECYEEYFRLQYETLLKYPLTSYDTLGHMDYMVRYGPNKNKYYHYSDYARWIEPILTYLIENDKCLEVNTGGFKYGLGEPNPSTEVLHHYYALGGRKITIGSDAHAPEYAAYDFKRCEAILRKIGFTSYQVFLNRVPKDILF